jgi:hypothetical protein
VFSTSSNATNAWFFTAGIALPTTGSFNCFILFSRLCTHTHAIKPSDKARTCTNVAVTHKFMHKHLLQQQPLKTRKTRRRVKKPGCASCNSPRALLSRSISGSGVCMQAKSALNNSFCHFPHAGSGQGAGRCQQTLVQDDTDSWVHGQTRQERAAQKLTREQQRSGKLARDAAAIRSPTTADVSCVSSHLC